MKKIESAVKHFEYNLMPFLDEDIEVEDFNPITGKYILYDTEFGTVDFFPRRNKILIRQKNEWIENGSLWIKKNLTTQNKQK